MAHFWDKQLCPFCHDTAVAHSSSSPSLRARLKLSRALWELSDRTAKKKNWKIFLSIATSPIFFLDISERNVSPTLAPHVHILQKRIAIWLNLHDLLKFWNLRVVNFYFVDKLSIFFPGYRVQKLIEINIVIFLDESIHIMENRLNNIFLYTLFLLVCERTLHLRFLDFVDF